MSQRSKLWHCDIWKCHQMSHFFKSLLQSYVVLLCLDLARNDSEREVVFEEETPLRCHTLQHTATHWLLNSKVNRNSSTTKISMKCIVNWIPLRIRVRSRNTQPHLKSQESVPGRCRPSLWPNIMIFIKPSRNNHFHLSFQNDHFCQTIFV